MNIRTLKQTDERDVDLIGDEAVGVSNGLGGVSAAFVPRKTYPKRDPSETWIYHERQESLLCGQHCLNNLLQKPVFTTVGLSEVAQALDREERLLYLDHSTSAAEQGKYLSEASGNVDESGNFSLEVLRRALLQSHQVELVSWTGETGKSIDPMGEVGFIVNRSSHWFTLRRIGGRWWNLNSTLGRPELVSDIYLSALLGELQATRWQIFIPRCRLPGCGSMPDNRDFGYNQSAWYTATELLTQPAPTASGSASSTATTTTQPPQASSFQGKGMKLGSTQEIGADSSSTSMDDQDQAAYDQEVQLIAESDPELALALALSREEAVASSSKPLAKDAMREKRLAALAARGL